jgi:hypothetical protein
MLTASHLIAPLPALSATERTGPMVALILERVDYVQSQQGAGVAALAPDHCRTRLALPDRAADPRSPSWLVTIFSGLSAAYRARRAAAVGRALRLGLANTE